MIFQYLIKLFISSGIILLVSEIAKKDNLIGGLIASIPIVSVLSLIWLYVDTNDIDKVKALVLLPYQCHLYQHIAISMIKQRLWESMRLNHQ